MEEIKHIHSRSSIEIIETADRVGHVAGNCTKNIVSRFARWIMFKLRRLFNNRAAD